MPQPIVAVSTDFRHFDNYDWHAAPHQYVQAVLKVGGLCPLLVPSLGDALDLDSILAAVDGVMVTGSKSNVHPGLYGGDASEGNGPYDPARDATTLPLLRRALELGVPVLAICRGLQELNVALGGTLATEIQELEGRMDHRAPQSEDQDERFAIRHDVEIDAGGTLSKVYEADRVAVNSVHRQAIGTLSDRLRVEAKAPDGTIEAVSVADAPGFSLGVQWHPEYWASSDENSERIFRAFAEAVRAYRTRRNTQLAAE